MLDKGIIIAGDIRVNLLDIELLTIKIRLLIVSVDKAQEMGIDWWRNDPMLTTSEQGLADENRRLRERLEALESGSSNRCERERAGRRSAPMAETGTGRYLYAITRGLDPARAGRAPSGIGDGALELVRAPRPDGRGQRRRLDEFGEDGLRRNLEDLAWLETVARGHDAVVHAVAAHGPTAPLRLATICLDDDGSAPGSTSGTTRCRRRSTGSRAAIEWSVKAFARSAPSRRQPRQTPRRRAGQGRRHRLPAAQAGPDPATQRRPRSRRLQLAERHPRDARAARGGQPRLPPRTHASPATRA